LAKMMSIN